MKSSTITERGQISIPAALRKAMHLRPGHRLAWEQISDHECRVIVQTEPDVAGPMSVLGYARKIHQRPSRRTSEWMMELREGETK